MDRVTTATRTSHAVGTQKLTQTRVCANPIAVRPLKEDAEVCLARCGAKPKLAGYS